MLKFNRGSYLPNEPDKLNLNTSYVKVQYATKIRIFTNYRI